MKKRISLDEETAVALKLVLRSVSTKQMKKVYLESDEIKMLHDLLQKLEKET